jgi:hypothetical protein
MSYDIPQTFATVLYEDNRGALLMASAAQPTKQITSYRDSPLCPPEIGSNVISCLLKMWPRV